MRAIRRLILHHSASLSGDRRSIDAIHVAKGWDQIGYHYVILNGWRTSMAYVPSEDGRVERGRDLWQVGSHDHGQNGDSIGICLVGLHVVTWKQLLSLHGLCQGLRAGIGAPLEIEGHFEHEPASTTTRCPGDRLRPLMDELRAWLDLPEPDAHDGEAWSFLVQALGPRVGG